MPTKVGVQPVPDGSVSVNHSTKRCSSSSLSNKHNGNNKSSHKQQTKHLDGDHGNNGGLKLDREKISSIQSVHDEVLQKNQSSNSITSSHSNSNSNNSNNDCVSFVKTGRIVKICHQIGQGGFGVVYKAKLLPQRAKGGSYGEPSTEDDIADTVSKSSDKDDCNTYFALKRIDCTGDQDGKLFEQCSNEVRIHQKLFDGTTSDGNYHNTQNVMPLVDFSCFTTTEQHIFFDMLFPFYGQSLEEDLADRHLMEDVLESERNSYSTIQVLELFLGVVRGVQALHDIVGVCHGDIKIENVLLRIDERSGCDNTPTPVLMDFGSCKPLIVPLHSPQDVIDACDRAVHDTTTSYRAPELWKQQQQETCQLLSQSNAPPQYLDYGRADVWSLGCVLFVMCYGATPGEIEWSISFVGNPADGTARYKNCSFSNDEAFGVQIDDEDEISSMLHNFPPSGSAAGSRYEKPIKDLIQWILQSSSTRRPTVKEVGRRVEQLILKYKRRN